MDERDKSRNMSRRDFLKASALAAAGTFLAACGGGGTENVSAGVNAARDKFGASEQFVPTPSLALGKDPATRISNLMDTINKTKECPSPDAVGAALSGRLKVNGLPCRGEGE